MASLGPGNRLNHAAAQKRMLSFCPRRSVFGGRAKEGSPESLSTPGTRRGRLSWGPLGGGWYTSTSPFCHLNLSRRSPMPHLHSGSFSATSGRPATDFPGSRPTDDQATLRGFPIVPALAAWLKRSSSSPARTAAISAGSLPFELTTIPALPFSNSSGLAPNFDGHDDLTGGVGLPHHAPTHLMRSRHRHRLGPSVAVEHSLCASQSEPSPSAE